ncbi:hypothetical protein EON63_08820 [archaeon]|nr:MAG: hypothetical protein EON63_08820 [archaeon]
MSEALGLGELKSRQWSIQETSALKGSGLFEGFDWYGLGVCEWDKIFIVLCVLCMVLFIHYHSVFSLICRLVTCIKGGE